MPPARPFRISDFEFRISTLPPAEHSAVQVHGVNSSSGSGSDRRQGQRQWAPTVSRRAREHKFAHPMGLSSRQVMAQTPSKVACTVAVQPHRRPRRGPADGGGHAAVAAPARCPVGCHGSCRGRCPLPLKLSLKLSLSSATVICHCHCNWTPILAPVAVIRTRTRTRTRVASDASTPSVCG